MVDSVHVAIFTDFHPRTLGGVQTAMRSLCDGLRLLGHRVTVFCAPAPGYETADADTVLLRALPISMSNGLPVVLPTRANQRLIDAAFAERGPIDLVHALTTYGCGISGARTARRHGIPVVQTMQSRDDTVIEKYSPAPYLSALTMRLAHGWFVPLRGRPAHDGDNRIARLAWRPLVAQAQAADRVIVPTHHFARRLARHGVDRPIHVVSNGIDDELLDSVRGAASAATNPDAPLRALWCGRLSVEKRPLEAIEVARLVEDCTLTVYGSGPLADQARSAVAEADLGHRVHLRGEVDQADCLRAMRTHDLLLLTSDCDTQGMVLLEAMAMGLPVLYCDPELSETVPDEGGVRAPDASVESLAAVLKSLTRDRIRLHDMRRVLEAHADEPRQSRHTSGIVSVYTEALAAAVPGE
ncbi:Glycosyltransferase involved in cell wall bisynthesis [Nocardia amikacinitolerans]|uniref:Glycosyltransferase involved in cell wall bisynthesis n=1 Tax=Nocardia amikacinitolerans TaxID=756689 RepID=A0A285LXH4_9NOCA|nr:glycosyltransferase [Nocardia amikacinitolerans]MCP2298686.1 Glycosyltransferase involved in cell wall bisynthesis [Nocardia amikacinitolerans]SNY89575.1 Glycosyltransferase involved in cell wall bisynthesis [Nocardia amikacinitolerans]